MRKRDLLLSGLLCLCWAMAARAAGPGEDVPNGTPTGTPNFHLVGWTNALLPGGGEVLLGNPGTALQQAVLEVGTFGYGFSLTKRSPMTIDGVPGGGVGADWLQIFGLKYHMVNTFNSYRLAARAAGEASDLDGASTSELFFAPFELKNLEDPWVAIPLGISAASILVDYFVQVNEGVPHRDRASAWSNALFATSQGVVIPFGSGAPEEMFYRGFLQNEFREVSRSPWLAIAASSILYSLSHEPGVARSSALVTGAYLGYLAHRNQGRLTPGITYHFWADVFAGIEEILLNRKAQRTMPPVALSFQIHY